MPIYTYRCTECGVEFDQHQNFSDAPLTKCPECGKKSLRKVFSPSGIIFKGKGWYATDHRSTSGSVNMHKETAEKAADTKASDSSPAAVSEKQSSESKSKSKSDSVSGESKS
jgi:putative FmdB family regulatory protein